MSSRTRWPTWSAAVAERARSARSRTRRGSTYTQVFNVTGWPSTVVRAGTSAEGLPIGVQVVAHPWREDVSLALAGYLEHALGPFPGPRL
jgi:amidase